jgi:hypothetical protein
MLKKTAASCWRSVFQDGVSDVLFALTEQTLSLRCSMDTHILTAYGNRATRVHWKWKYLYASFQCIRWCAGRREGCGDERSAGILFGGCGQRQAAASDIHDEDPYVYRLVSSGITGGVTVVETTGFQDKNTRETLYANGAPAQTEPIPLRLIPYCAWAKRGIGEMAV